MAKKAVKSSKSSVSSNRFSKFRKSFGRSRWLGIVPLILVVVIIVGVIGVNYMGSSHAAPGDARTFQFWAGRSDDIHYCPARGSTSDGCWGFDTIGAGWHWAWCQSNRYHYPSGETVTFDGYYNDWWIHLLYHQSGWINAVFASGGGNDQPVPGIPICDSTGY